MPLRLLIVLALIVTLGTALLGLRPATAEAAAPWDVAEQVRRGLFSAQTALLRDDRAAAEAELDAAATLYADSLSAMVQEQAPGAAAHIEQGIADAHQAVADGNGPFLSLARAQIWGGLLEAGASVAISSAEAGDVTSARSWLLLREYRPSTRFSQASAEATLELKSLERELVSPADAAAALRSDLYDTYQALLLQELGQIEAGLANDLPLRHSEAAGLARAYWWIIAGSFEEQLGIEARTAAEDALAHLVDAAERGDEAALGAAVGEVRDQLRGFRAVPLTVEEQSRRANQLIRFLSLVPVEYRRGVRNGEVTLDIEIQEAVTFLNGSQAALEDLWPQLTEADPAARAEITTLLDRIDAQLASASRREAVEAPETLEAETNQALDLLRAAFPAEWLSSGGDSEFEEIERLLDEIEVAVASGEYGKAEQLRLEAYAVFDFGPELRLLGFKPELAARIEGLIWHGYGSERGLATVIAKHGSPEQFAATRAPLDAALEDARITLNAGPPPAGAVIFNSAVIVFREGLEAVLIFAALMASMIGVYSVYRRPLVIGGLAAFGATALTWVAFHYLLSSLRVYGEKLEAVVSLVAIGVLLLVLNWFFHNTYWSRWIQQFHGKKRSIMGMAAGQSASFVLLGFASVYREGFETTLFLQALVLDAGTLTVLQGVALGLLGTAVVGVLVFALQAKLPHKKLLIVTGLMISAVLVTMVGNTVHILQAVGWLPISPIERISPPYWAGQWLGIFPTWEGVILQVVSGVFVIGSYFVAERLKTRQRTLSAQTSS
jgi:high-affinity iron transporter